MEKVQGLVSESLPEANESPFKNAKLVEGSLLSASLDKQRAELARKHVRALNNQFVRKALASLETDPGLHPLVPLFTCFIAEEIVRNMDNYSILLALMHLARSLLHNPHVHIEPYLHQLMPSIITCLIAKRLGTRLSDNHWGLRSFTACTVASTCKSRVMRTEEIAEDVRREVHIMYHLIGQPNIVELEGAYEDNFLKLLQLLK